MEEQEKNQLQSAEDQCAPLELSDDVLDDILKEFGSVSSDPEPEEAYAAPDPEIAEPETAEPEADESEADEPEIVESEMPVAAVTSDTIRLDTISIDGAMLRGTPALDAQPIEDEDDTPVEEAEASSEQPDKPAPFEGDWEPEYEQPMGEYIPEPPIIMHPRSRLRELKRKLIAGPEKIYYDLTEKGLGKLQLAMFFNLLVVLATAALSLAYDLNAIADNRLRLVVFCQFLAMLISALLGSNLLIEGVTAVFKKRFTLNSMLVVTFLVCCVDGVFSLIDRRIPCCAAFSLEMTMSLWSAYHRRNTQMGQMDTMRKATNLSSLHAVPDYLEGKKGLLRGEGQVEHFMDTYDQESKPEQTLGIYSLAAVILAIVLGVVMGILKGVSVGVQLTAVTLLAAMPATAFICVSRPMCILERRLHSLGAVLCGWQGVEGLRGKVLFPLEHTDLFPAGTVRMNGVKFFGTRDPDLVVAYTGALIMADNGSLSALFESLVDSRNVRHCPVDNFRYYDHGGIGGEVCGEPVLVGSLSFLRSMGVDVPEDIRVESAVCSAVDGELCGLFALTYEKLKGTASGLVTLSGYRGLQGVMLSDDFMLTQPFLSGIFGGKAGRLLYPDHEIRAQLRDVLPDADAPALALSVTGTLSSFAFCATGARALNTATRWGMVLHILGGLLGIAIVAVLSFLNAIGYLTPVNMFLYQLVWIAPALLITEWTRSV